MVSAQDVTITTTNTLDGVQLTYINHTGECDIIDEDTGELIACIDDSGQFTYVNEWAKQTCQTLIIYPYKNANLIIKTREGCKSPSHKNKKGFYNDC